MTVQVYVPYKMWFGGNSVECSKYSNKHLDAKIESRTGRKAITYSLKPLHSRLVPTDSTLNIILQF